MALDVSKGIAHLDHLEDLVILYGKEGAKLASETIFKFVKKFEKNAEETSDLTISEKIDGAPSLYFGTAPDGRFFVGTKGVLSKTEQKIAYSLTDIRRLYQGGVENVLAQAYNALKPAFREKGYACQGDLLWYDKGGKSESTIEGKALLTFQPNTILYGIPVDPKSNVYKKASRAVLGIVIHGVYETQFIEGERVEFNRQGIDRVREFADALNQHPNVFCIHPYVDNVDVISASEEVLKEIEQTLQAVHTSQAAIDNQFDREWRKGDNDYIKMAKVYLPQFINQQVRSSGEEETILTAKDEKEFLKRFKMKFKEFVNVKGKAEVEKMKSLKGKEQKGEAFKEFLGWMADSESTFEPMFLCFFRLYNIKVLIIQLLDGLEKKLGQTFVVDRKGDFAIKAVKPEGYVFLSGENMVKIVDRLEFSRNNMVYGRFAEESEAKQEKKEVIVERSFADEVVEDVLSAMEAAKKLNDGWNDEQIVEAASSMKNYSVIYVGRFQPPTIAHVQNIINLSKLFKEVYILVSKAENTTPKFLQKNPLSDEERIQLFDTDPKLKTLSNVTIKSGPTYMVYGINSPNADTGRPNEEEVKKLLGIPQEETVVLALGKEDDRYYATKQTGKFFDVNSGQKPSEEKRVGLYGIELIPAGETGKVSASTIRDAIVSGDLDTAEQYLAGSDSAKGPVMETLRDRLQMVNKALEAKPKKKKAKELAEEDTDGIEKINQDEAFDIIVDALEE